MGSTGEPRPTTLGGGVAIVVAPCTPMDSKGHGKRRYFCRSRIARVGAERSGAGVASVGRFNEPKVNIRRTICDKINTLPTLLTLRESPVTLLGLLLRKEFACRPFVHIGRAISS